MTAVPAAEFQEPVLPRYGGGALSDLLPAVGARLGVAGCADPLGLPDADRWVVLLVDGLGDQLLTEYAEEAPYLTSLSAGRPALTVGVPSTSSTTQRSACGRPNGSAHPGTPSRAATAGSRSDSEPPPYRGTTGS